MTDNHQPPAVPAPHINFEAPAVLRKWPSLNNQRRTEGPGPYLLIDGTLDECIREFMAKPAPMRHLYEIHTSPQPPLVADVLSGEIVAELARLREFLLPRLRSVPRTDPSARQATRHRRCRARSRLLAGWREARA